MKGIKLLFAVCLAPLAFQGAAADNVGDAARAAVRRNSTATSVSNRQKTNSTATTNTNASRTSRTGGATTQTSARERTGNVVSRTTVAPATTNRTDTAATSARATANIISRPTATGTASTSERTNMRSAIIPINRNASRTATQSSRSATIRGTLPASASMRSRAATGDALTREGVLSKNYSKCREVYYECMDEFCANKDTQLRRCACSSRVNEFDKVKKQLANAEEKMLDFNQRLLTVNMEKEDAAALYTATEGELAFNQKDTSASKKMLDEIAKKLNTSFNSSNFDTNAISLSWSLNEDAAFDNIDSMFGASSTGKTGTALYAAALPVCREMAAEVCSEDELAIATSGYQMTIEQDCNTVAKAYQTQTDQAREKIREGSALLDMSRLDIYQKRNSDDILTCKKKMLTMLSDTAVCGTDLGKCLDTSGKYIDPSTGEAFLTEYLADLSTLITRPDADQTWTTAPGNDVFVSFLKSKKKYLEPAMESCQDIADSVWDAFVEDALAQIKLAQDKKLETMRQSCTTLTTQCLANAAKSLADFDARALSIFGVAADKTVNAMCNDINVACSALLKSTGGGDTDWVGGMTQIATDTTYETVIQTCREVGRNCIVQACKSIAGNFGLCENIQTSVNRKAIISRTSCWDDVRKCVDSAGSKSISNIIAQLTERGEIDPASNSFYSQLYGTANLKITNSETAASCAFQSISTNSTLNCVYDLCADDCGCGYANGAYQCASADTKECQVCRLTEKIWGNCEVAPSTPLAPIDSHNRIRIPSDDKTATLLSWFAVNTGTQNMTDSCRDTSCGIGYTLVPDELGIYSCIANEMLAIGDGKLCADDKKINLGSISENCCAGKIIGSNCYINYQLAEGLQFEYSAMTAPSEALVPSGQSTYPILAFSSSVDEGPYTAGNYYLLCMYNGSGEAITVDEDDKKMTCNGKYLWMYIPSDGRPYYFAPMSDMSPLNSYQTNNGSETCKWKYIDETTGWAWQQENGAPCNDNGNGSSWTVDYSNWDQ